MKNLTLNMDNALSVCKAIANEHRMNILKILSHGPHNVNELSEKLGLPFSTTAVNVKKLEEVGLITTELVPGRGTQKINSKNFDRIVIDLFEGDIEFEKNTISIEMPVGEFIDVHAEPSCGLVGEHDYIGMQDDPRSFYETDRHQAQLLFFKNGYVEYRFPNRVPYGARPSEIEFSAELCSEAPYFKLDWPSDITLWVNQTDVGTWTSPGDFGGERGFNTPKWWGIHNTQFGLLKTWKINREGTFLDGVNISDITISDLAITENPYISLRFGIKEDAVNVGGINLFGKEFGNYRQAIVMNLRYENQK
ncbi:ArsR/SmtB family transcription factor [Salisediminibacterium selenitireducens]|uniref:Transcriptional regulator, ArsR family n=1 Tax=Bacillus selenitireducens (strain ATCC 700615 / DSM 15326 / MLS10) TaxID=439292 RepID=D6Y1C4_BACIE|nr:helix-turn-helix domain-containing protein [Salisediminibacterium selenitireducens]ADI00711.1 transcriptional regulator, ArsR family [[Bacillus] selenitireducens MLS10]